MSVLWSAIWSFLLSTFTGTVTRGLASDSSEESVGSLCLYRSLLVVANFDLLSLSNLASPSKLLSKLLSKLALLSTEFVLFKGGRVFLCCFFFFFSAFRFHTSTKDLYLKGSGSGSSAWSNLLLLSDCRVIDSVSVALSMDRSSGGLSKWSWSIHLYLDLDFGAIWSIWFDCWADDSDLDTLSTDWGAGGLSILSCLVSTRDLYLDGSGNNISFGAIFSLLFDCWAVNSDLETLSTDWVSRGLSKFPSLLTSVSASVGILVQVELLSDRSHSELKSCTIFGSTDWNSFDFSITFWLSLTWCLSTSGESLFSCSTPGSEDLDTITGISSIIGRASSTDTRTTCFCSSSALLCSCRAGVSLSLQSRYSCGASVPTSFSMSSSTNLFSIFSTAAIGVSDSEESFSISSSCSSSTNVSVTFSAAAVSILDSWASGSGDASICFLIGSSNSILWTLSLGVTPHSGVNVSNSLLSNSSSIRVPAVEPCWLSGSLTFSKTTSCFWSSVSWSPVHCFLKFG